MFGSLLTRPYRFATRGVRLTIRGTCGVIELTESVLGAVAERIIGGSPNGASNGTPTHADPDPQTAPDTPAGPDTVTAPDPDAPLGRETRPGTEGPPTPEPPAAEPELNAAEPASAPEPPSATWRPVTETGDDVVASSAADEPVHVSEEPELVEEFAEPGAEEGAGAQLRILEPWAGYNEMKAADIVQRLAFATREELAAVELYELAGRNRESVVAAAQEALKRASPPR